MRWTSLKPKWFCSSYEIMKLLSLLNKQFEYDYTAQNAGQLVFNLEISSSPKYVRVTALAGKIHLITFVQVR